MTQAAVYDPPQVPLDILHEDHQIVVVNKPAGLLSVPGRGPDLADCLITRIQAVFPQPCWCIGWTATPPA